MTRRSPTKNVPALGFVAFLDGHATIEEDLDGVTRHYINGVWVDDIRKREIRRYRRGHIRTVRPTTVTRLLGIFHLEDAWHQQQ